MELRLLNFLILIFVTDLSLALRFGNIPITVDSDVILVNKPTLLKCNYVKFRTETVREINWFISYKGFSAQIFNFMVSTGQKKNSIYSHIRTDGDTATEDELTVTFPEFRGTPVTVGCEVKVLRDNGYGKLSTLQKRAELPVTVVDTLSHSMTLKNGKWDSSNYINQFEASVGQPLLVSCISKNANPSPNLTLYLNDQPWEATSGTSAIQEVRLGVPSGTKVIEGRMDTVYDQMFNAQGILNIECKAMFKDFMIEKKQLGLKKKRRQIVSESQFARPSAFGHNQIDNNSGSSGGRKGRVVQNSNGHLDNNLIHSRLLDLLDPAKHMHPGIPYDFYSGYILMVAKNVDMDDDDNDVTTGGYYGSRGNSRSPAPTTHLYGQLPGKVVMDLQRNYGRFRKVTDEKFKIEMNPVDVLNMLGNHGYRVIGFTAEADRKMVWTLEQRDFEDKIMGPSRHQHL